MTFIKTISEGVCPMDQFYCGNNTCIPIAWACDGVSDCEDNSDETKYCISGKIVKNIFVRSPGDIN